jgi:hypothetical protein
LRSRVSTASFCVWATPAVRWMRAFRSQSLAACWHG